MEFKDLNLLDIGHTIQLTGAVYSGNGKHYLTIFPDEHHQDFSKAEVLQMSHPEWEKFLRQTDLLETEILTEDKESGRLIKAIVRKSQRQIDQAVSWAVFHRDGFKCRYCGRGNGTPLTVDHLVLWEEGGPSIEANLLSACKKCNRTRGNKWYTDWIKTDYFHKVTRAIGTDAVLELHRIGDTLENIP